MRYSMSISVGETRSVHIEGRFLNENIASLDLDKYQFTSDASLLSRTSSRHVGTIVSYEFGDDQPERLMISLYEVFGILSVSAHGTTEDSAREMIDEFIHLTGATERYDIDETTIESRKRFEQSVLHSFLK